MIYEWLYRKVVESIIEECLRQSKPNAPVKLDPLEYPTMTKLGVTHMHRSKVPGCPPIFLLPPSVEIDTKKPRMRCYPSIMYCLGVPVLEETWLCQSESVQGYGNSMVHAYFDWALRLSSAERVMRGIVIEY